MWKNQNLQGIGVLLGFLIVFFSTPLFNFRNETYSAADISQIYALTNTEPGYIAKNALLSDTIVQSQPWQIFNRDLVRTGRIALWNPYNANGVPQLANFQSAFFSPYTIPFYVLPFKFALLVTAFLKLFGIGLFTFLFLKQINLRQLPALIGATAFMFSGYNIVWLGYPHSASAACLPACIYFSERLFRQVSVNSTVQRAEQRSAARASWSLVGFCLSLTVGVLSGHPETFYACSLLITAYIGFRLIDLWRTGGYKVVVLPNLSLTALKFVFAGVFVIMLTAVQIVPFFEYLQNSDFTHNKNASLAYLPDTFWPLSLYPDLLDNPSNPSMLHFMEYSIGTDYNETNGMYIGGVVCFLAYLALGSALFQWGALRSYLLFFSGVAVVWLIYATNLFGFKTLFNLIPGVSVMYFNRTYPIWLFAVSCCAALFINFVFEFPGRQFRHSWIGIAFWGLAFLAVEAYGAYQLVQKLYPTTVSQYSSPVAALELHSAFVLQHIQVFTLSFAVGLFAICALWMARHELTKVIWGSLLLLIIFFQSGLWLKDFNPTIPDRLFYADSPITSLLRDSLKSQNIAILGTGLLASDMNIVYKLPVLSSYDTLGVQAYVRLLDAKFQPFTDVKFLTRFDEAGLRLFGVDTLIVDDLAKYKDILTPDKFQLISADQARNFAIYKVIRNVPLYHIVYHARIASSDAQAFTMVQESDFDPATSVVLSQPVNDLLTEQPIVSGVTDGAASVEILSETPSDIRLKVTQDRPGYLVLTKTYYPGWKVKVNDSPQSLYRANYAFNAVMLQPGESIVDYYYDPDSFKYGAILSICGVACGAALVLRIILRQRLTPSSRNMDSG